MTIPPNGTRVIWRREHARLGAGMAQWSDWAGGTMDASLRAAMEYAQATGLAIEVVTASDPWLSYDAAEALVTDAIDGVGGLPVFILDALAELAEDCEHAEYEGGMIAFRPDYLWDDEALAVFEIQVKDALIAHLRTFVEAQKHCFGSRVP